MSIQQRRAACRTARHAGEQPAASLGMRWLYLLLHNLWYSDNNRTELTGMHVLGTATLSCNDEIVWLYRAS